MNIPNFESFDTKILEAYIEAIQKELKARSEERKDKLIEDICESINTLINEFPFVKLCLPHRCEECGDRRVIDIFEILHNYDLTLDNSYFKGGIK